MAKRKRYTIQQLMRLEDSWTSKLLRAANKVAEFRKRRIRALNADEKTRPATKTVDEVMATPEPNARELTIDPLAVPCTTCDVGPGAECQTSNGKSVRPHATRVRDAVMKRGK